MDVLISLLVRFTLKHQLLQVDDAGYPASWYNRIATESGSHYIVPASQYQQITLYGNSTVAKNKHKNNHKHDNNRETQDGFQYLSASPAYAAHKLSIIAGKRNRN
jgi:hypothetical protein